MENNKRWLVTWTQTNEVGQEISLKKSFVGRQEAENFAEEKRELDCCTATVTKTR